MAAKIGVLKPHQNISDTPATFVKKAVAALMVRRLIAEDVRRGLIRLLLVNPASEISAARAAPAPMRGSLPDSEPSELLHGAALRWEPPESKRPLKGHPWGAIFVTVEPVRHSEQTA